MAPSARIGSGSASTIAAGAVPARIASASTLELELDPRPESITRTRPARFAPRWGWCTSTMSPVAGSTPPQKLSGSSRTSARPSASPATSVVASGIAPELGVPNDAPFDRRTHALLEAAERDPDADVRGRVPRPLGGIRHDRTAADERRDVRAGVRDDVDPGRRQRTRDAEALRFRQHVAPGIDPDRYARPASGKQRREPLELGERGVRRSHADRSQLVAVGSGELVSSEAQPFEGHRFQRDVGAAGG